MRSVGVELQNLVAVVCHDRIIADLPPPSRKGSGPLTPRYTTASPSLNNEALILCLQRHSVGGGEATAASQAAFLVGPQHSDIGKE
jgi:hypothetical protein